MAGHSQAGLLQCFVYYDGLVVFLRERGLFH